MTTETDRSGSRTAVSPDAVSPDGVTSTNSLASDVATGPTGRWRERQHEPLERQPEASVDPAPPSAALVVATAVQIAQSLLWMFAGLLIAGGTSTLASADPAVVVLVIAAILVFCVGGFMLALAAGTAKGSDVCRIASIGFQGVLGAIALGRLVVVLTSGSSVRPMLPMDPSAGPAFLFSTGFGFAMLASCVFIGGLLSTGQAVRATHGDQDVEPFVPPFACDLAPASPYHRRAVFPNTSVLAGSSTSSQSVPARSNTSA